MTFEPAGTSTGRPLLPWSPVRPTARPVIRAASGSLVVDTDGREYIDASSLSLTCGYANPRVIDSVRAQLHELPGLDLSAARHLQVDALAARVGAVLPDGLNRTLFLNSGSEGIEAALFMSLRAWRLAAEPRDRVITMERGYHGSTLLTRSLSGLPASGHDMRDPVPVTRVPLTASAAAVRTPAAGDKLIASFRAAFDAGDPPAAVVIEPLLNVGGGIVLPPGFLTSLRGLCDETGTHLVLDEVFTGWARTGRMFGFEHDNVVPDLLVTSKGLGGGYFPISAVTPRDEIVELISHDPVFGGLRYGHTTSGHPGACAAALAVLDIIEQEGLVKRADELGRRLLGRLESLTSVEHVVDVRGLGMVVVIETSTPEVADRVMARARERGVLLRQQMASLYVVPPLTVSEEHLELVVDCVVASVLDGG